MTQINDLPLRDRAMVAHRDRLTKEKWLEVVTVAKKLDTMGIAHIEESELPSEPPIFVEGVPFSWHDNSIVIEFLCSLCGTIYNMGPIHCLADVAEYYLFKENGYSTWQCEKCGE